MLVHRLLIVSLFGAAVAGCGHPRSGGDPDGGSPPVDLAAGDGGLTCVSFCASLTARCVDAGTAAACIDSNCLHGHEDDRIATLGCGVEFRAMLACYTAHDVCDTGTMGAVCRTEGDALGSCVAVYCAAHPGPPEC